MLFQGAILIHVIRRIDAMGRTAKTFVGIGVIVGLVSGFWLAGVEALSEPESTITAPDNGTYLPGAIQAIEGTASDSAGIAKVEIFIRNNEVMKYWDGTEWKNEKQLLLCAGTTSWSYDASGMAWEANTTYSIGSLATNSSGAVQASPCEINVKIIEQE
jgi:hypothetical protein